MPDACCLLLSSGGWGLNEDLIREVEHVVRANDEWRLRQTINLIASENVLSARARALLPSDFGHRYAEGHPEKGKRYYQGTKHIDVIEAKTRDNMKKLSSFGDSTGSGRRAFPITAPNARSGSLAFIACPGVDEVVSRSPTSTGA